SKLFVEKSTRRPVPDKVYASERLKLQIEETRKRLGLGPAKAAPKPSAGTNYQTYDDELNQLIDSIVIYGNANPDDLRPFRDPSISPAKLLAKLKDTQLAIEKEPASVWGILTPRSVSLEYAGMDYKIPFAFISMVLIAILTPVIAGWFSVLYITRQREIFEIIKSKKLKYIFPHILNFLPVILENEASQPAQKFIRGSLIGLRLFILLVLLAPIICIHVYSGLLLWSINSYDFPWIAYLYGFFAIYIFVQALVLMGQEWVLLRGKQFTYVP